MGWSRCGLVGVNAVVVGQAGKPSFEEGPQGAVEGARASLQQQVRAPRRPLHLLALGESLADDGVHRGLSAVKLNPLDIRRQITCVV